MQARIRFGMGEDSWGVIAMRAREWANAPPLLAIDLHGLEREGESIAAGRMGGCGWETLRDGTVMRRGDATN
jgi:hypothetical protein